MRVFPSLAICEGKNFTMKHFIKGFFIITILFFGFSLFILSNHIGGWRSCIVISGSMEPTVPTGSLVFTEYLHPSVLQQGDIITFIRPAKEHDFITHRIASVQTKDELTTIHTKGDHNQVSDPWVLAGGGVVGKVMFWIPLLGYFMAFLSSKTGIFLFVLVPSVYIVIEEINYIKALLKKHTEKRPVNAEAMAMMIALITATGLTVSATHSLLSDSAALNENNFTFAKDTTVTPTDTAPCGMKTTVIIKNNGAGSTNTVTVNNNCDEY
jgi:signal peptidase